MAILSEKTWRRHSNPWSGWTRVLSMPLLAVGLYLHSWWILGLTIIWLVINPIFFRETKNINNWMSMGVLGEELYYEGKRYIKKDLPTLLSIMNVPVFIYFLYSAWDQNLDALILSGLLVMTLKFWFIDRMVRLYIQRKEA